MIIPFRCQQYCFCSAIMMSFHNWRHPRVDFHRRICEWFCTNMWLQLQLRWFIRHRETIMILIFESINHNYFSVEQISIIIGNRSIRIASARFSSLMMLYPLLYRVIFQDRIDSLDWLESIWNRLDSCYCCCCYGCLSIPVHSTFSDIFGHTP